MSPHNQDQIATLLTQLKLKHFHESLVNDLPTMTPEARQSVFKYIHKWADFEMAQRKTQAIAAKIRSAKFRRIQTIDSFNFKHSKTTEKIEKPFLTLYNGMARDSLPSAVFTGNAGTGKTHLARALGYGACQKGLSALFITAAEMVNNLTHAQKTFTLEAELNKYRRPLVLVIDELGYVSLDVQASNLFFQVISARHDQGVGTVATTNIPFGRFNQIFSNDAIAHAIVDRLANEAEIFFLEGDSYREHQRKEKLKRKEKSG